MIIQEHNLDLTALHEADFRHLFFEHLHDLFHGVRKVYHDVVKLSFNLYSVPRELIAEQELRFKAELLYMDFSFLCNILLSEFNLKDAADFEILDLRSVCRYFKHLGFQDKKLDDILMKTC